LTLKIHVLNVGSGDSTVIEYIDENNTLWAVIDCYKENESHESETLKFLKQKNVTEIYSICLTHPDLDHYNGLLELVDYFSDRGRNLTRFIAPILDHTKYKSIPNSKREEQKLRALYSLLSQLAEKDKIHYDQFGYGQPIFFPYTDKVIALGPLVINTEKYAKQIYEREKKRNIGEKPSKVDKNLLSVIIGIIGPKTLTILCSDATSHIIETTLKRFTGDRKKSNEITLFNFVKVPHHGSAESNYPDLWSHYCIKNISVAGISAGPKYGHPHLEVVKNILESNVKVYCTNKVGCIRSITQNKSVAINESSSTIIEGLQQSTKSINLSATCEPLHGTITFIDDGAEIKIETEYQELPILSLDNPY